MWINVFFMYWLSYRIRWLSITDEVALSERNTHVLYLKSSQCVMAVYPAFLKLYYFKMIRKLKIACFEQCEAD